MKQLLILFSCILLVGLTGCSLDSLTNRVKGSGNIKTEKRDVAAFNSIEVKCFGTVHVTAQGQENLEITGDDNILPLITATVSNNTLYISSKEDYSPSGKFEINISAPNIEKFDFSGAGEAGISKVKNNRTEITVSGAANVTASGETKEAAITLTGAANIDAKNLHAEKVKVSSTGAGSINVYASGELDAETSGVGSIDYYGNPKVVHKRASGISSINPK